MRVEEEREARNEVVDRKPCVDAVLDILEPVTQGERQLLQRGRTRFANVIAAHGNGVPLRHPLRAEPEDVSHQPHGWTRREDVLLLGDELFEDVVLNRPGDVLPVGALLLGDDEIHREDHRRRRIDRHRRRDVAERDPVEEPLHVGQRRDVDTALADLAERQRMVGVASHQRRQVEGHRESSAAGGNQILITLVGFLRRPKPRKLSHRPQLAAVAGGVNAANVRELARVADLSVVVDPLHILRRIQPLDRPPGNCRERSGALGRLLERRFEHLAFPALLGRSGPDRWRFSCCDHYIGLGSPVGSGVRRLARRFAPRGSADRSTARSMRSTQSVAAAATVGGVRRASEARES